MEEDMDDLPEFNDSDFDGLEDWKKTPEEIEEIMRLANMKPADTAPLVQCLYSSVSLEEQQNRKFKVIELDDHLHECLKNGEGFTFRGDEEEPAVLCTSTRTYEVKEAETSNTCLAVPNLKLRDDIMKLGLTERRVEKVEIAGIFNKYLEVKECTPRLSKLLTVLEPSSFKGLEYEKLIDKSTLYDWERLQSRIQASDGEIRAALAEYMIAEIDGYYRLISFEFQARAVPLMLDLIEENSWELDEIDKEISYESLKEIIPRSVFELLFKKYTILSQKTSEDGTQLYEYSQEKASRLLAHILLTACPTNSYDDFMEAWKMGSPESIPPKEEYLYGIAIIVWNERKMRKEVVFYPDSNLPDDVNKRLDQLFKMKEKWTVPEITPYIMKFTTSKEDVNAILTKYTRPSTSQGVKYYSSKHGK